MEDFLFVLDGGEQMVVVAPLQIVVANMVGEAFASWGGAGGAQEGGIH